MPNVASSITIQALPEQLFVLSQHYGLRLEWDPFVRELKFLDGVTRPEVGVKVWVRARNGLGMEAEYVTVKPPDTVAIKMTRGPRFFSRFSGSWTFHALGPETTEVVFRYHFAIQPTALAWLLEPVIGRVFLRDIRARLEALKHHAEQTDILTRLDTR
jgi:ribosome-associated toxin RatA of RatAB toxin-antitoxin module